MTKIFNQCTVVASSCFLEYYKMSVTLILRQKESQFSILGIHYFKTA